MKIERQSGCGLVPQSVPISTLIEQDPHTATITDLNAPLWRLWRNQSFYHITPGNSLNRTTRCSSQCSRYISISKRGNILRTWTRSRLKDGGRAFLGNGEMKRNPGQIRHTIWTILTSVRNRGELSEGWYDPTTLQKAIASAAEQETQSRDDSYRPAQESSRKRSENVPREEVRESESDSDDSVGPALPGQESRSRRSRKGPSIPNLQDLELKRGLLLPLPNLNILQPPF